MKKASAMKNQRNMQSAKKGTFARLLKYLFKYYGWQIIIMCITLLMVSVQGRNPRHDQNHHRSARGFR